MAGTFPAITGGFRQVTKGPEYLVRILRFIDGSEQRVAVQGEGLLRIEFTYPRIKAGDAKLLRDFYDAQKGSFDPTWSVTIDGLTYNNMTFEVDAYREDEVIPAWFRVSCKARQTKT